MSAGEALKRQELAVTQHFTEPPPRFSEASLVKRMEELSIGRPSTYASILQVLKDRGYVKLDKKRLHARTRAASCRVPRNFFTRYVEYDFTADLEEQLDRHLEQRDFLAAGAEGFWTGFIARSTTSRTCASPRCWMRSTTCGPAHLSAAHRWR